VSIRGIGGIILTKVSVIVAAYNVEKYIKKCIETVINQTLDDIEIVIVNDGSTDKTLNEISNFCNNDSRIKVINKSNEGLIEARKSGLESATGKYILFLDGDDWLREDTCEILYNCAMKNSVDIVYFNLLYAYDNKIKENYIYDFDYCKDEEYLKLVLTNKIRANAVLQFLRLQFIKDKKIEFPKEITYAEDLAITVSLAINKPRVKVITDGLYYYYQRQGSITKTISHKIFDVEKVIDIVSRQLEDNNLIEKYKQEFDYLAYMHLYYYRLVDVNKVSDIHTEIFKRWKLKNISIDNNTYYKEFIRTLSIYERIIIYLYNRNYELGKNYINLINIVYVTPKKYIKTIFRKLKVI